MNTEKSYIVYGPPSCGKTRNAKAIAKVLGLRQVIDGWGGDESGYRLFNTLHLTNTLPAWAVENRRVLTFDAAMALVNTH